MAIKIKPENKGKLHRALGVPEGKKIPVSKIEKAKHSDSPALRKEANFALNFRNAGKKQSSVGKELERRLAKKDK